MRSQSNDPVIFLEPKSRYWPKGEVDLADRGAPLHATRVVRVGTDVTLVGHGAMVSVLLQAADSPPRRARASRSSTCARCRPIDYGPILESVRKTGRLVVAQEAPGFASVGSEIAATVAERAFYSLEAPVLRVSGFDTPFPPAKLEAIYLPDADRVLEAVDRASRTEPRGPGPPKEAPHGDPEFLLPDVGEGLTEAEIVSWKVAPGDTVAVNQVLVEIETAKSLVELPSPFAGTVDALLVAEGETVDVGTPIITGRGGGCPARSGPDGSTAGGRRGTADTAASVSHEVDEKPARARRLRDHRARAASRR